MASASIVVGIGVIIMCGVLGYADTPKPDWTNVALASIVGLCLISIGILDMRGPGLKDDEEV